MPNEPGPAGAYNGLVLGVDRFDMARIARMAPTITFGNNYDFATTGFWTMTTTSAQYTLSVPTPEERRAEALRVAVREARCAGTARDACHPERWLRKPEEFNWTPEDVRLVQDAHQRATEERIERDRIREARLAETAAAEERARKLLESLLTEEQREEWRTHGHVIQVAPSGRVWRLRPMWAGGAEIMDNGTARAKICVHPGVRVPECDVVAALLVALRGGDEDHVIQLGILHEGDWSEEERVIRRAAVLKEIWPPRRPGVYANIIYV